LGFNLKRDVRPLATNSCQGNCTQYVSFNLKRDVRPLATGGCLAPLVERAERAVCEAQGFCCPFGPLRMALLYYT